MGSFRDWDAWDDFSIRHHQCIGLRYLTSPRAQGDGNVPASLLSHISCNSQRILTNFRARYTRVYFPNFRNFPIIEIDRSRKLRDGWIPFRVRGQLLIFGVICGRGWLIDKTNHHISESSNMIVFKYSEILIFKSKH